MVNAFLNILEILSFDDNLFRKEFIKTIHWISTEEFETVRNWMSNNKYSEKYPDLLTLVQQ
jgi:hypothetical protein